MERQNRETILDIIYTILFVVGIAMAPYIGVAVGIILSHIFGIGLVATKDLILAFGFGVSVFIIVYILKAKEK